MPIQQALRHTTQQHAHFMNGCHFPAQPVVLWQRFFLLSLCACILITGCDAGNPQVRVKDHEPQKSHVEPESNSVEVSQPIGGHILTTQNFVVTVTNLCPEGDVACDNFQYTGVSKKTGDKISLKGSSLHTTCADGTSPCRFLGYEFHNGDIKYRVLDAGVLQVIDGKDQVLLNEQGQWSY